ncbi:MAG: thioredoxin [Thermoactinomyces sp.]
MAIIELTDQDFSQKVQSPEAGLVLVDFWAPWCGPCRMVAPELEKVDAELGDKVTIAKVNVDNNPQTAGNFGVMSIPTLMLFKNGQAVSKIVGAQPKEQLVAWINEHL